MSDLAAIIAPMVCWAFLRAVYLAAYGIELHDLGHVAGDVQRDIPFAYTEAGSGRWCPVTVPQDGDAVAMGRRARPHHVGVWLAAEGGLIAHCAEPMGVTVAPRRALAAIGWGSFRFYRHKARA